MVVRRFETENRAILTSTFVTSRHLMSNGPKPDVSVWASSFRSNSAVANMDFHGAGIVVAFIQDQT